MTQVLVLTGIFESPRAGFGPQLRSALINNYIATNAPAENLKIIRLVQHFHW